MGNSSPIAIELDHIRLTIYTFPEMIEARRLHKEIRFSCSLSCDISGQGDETYGAITNISIGGCLLNVHEDNKLWIIEKALESQQPIDLEVFLPIAELSVVIAGVVKSITPQSDGSYQIGVAFNQEYDCIHRYLQALHLELVLLKLFNCSQNRAEQLRAVRGGYALLVMRKLAQ